MLKRTTKSRLHIRSIDNAPAPFDMEIAELFREMRQATGHTIQEIASRLKTPTETIYALEQGDLSSLPDWNETGRVIYEYTNILKLDPEPVMRRVMVQLPADHPKRPRTQVHEPSYDNVRANANAVMNRVPGSQRAVENPSISMVGHEFAPEPPFSAGHPPSGQYGDARQASGGFADQAGGMPLPSGFSPGYGDMRAIPRSLTMPGHRAPAHQVAKPRKSSVFVPLIQLLLLLIILGTGYSMWLAVNDPQGFEDLKGLALRYWVVLQEQYEIIKTTILKQLSSL